MKNTNLSDVPEGKLLKLNLYLDRESDSISYNSQDAKVSLDF
jgi:hypothetical protein